MHTVLRITTNENWSLTSLAQNASDKPSDQTAAIDLKELNYRKRQQYNDHVTIPGKGAMFSSVCIQVCLLRYQTAPGRFDNAWILEAVVCHLNGSTFSPNQLHPLKPFNRYS